MTDFLRTILLINGYIACALVIFCLLVAPPAHADDGGVVGAIAGAIASSMDVNEGEDDD